MDLFNYIIAPFEFIVREIYLFSYSITENYGISVILLSLGISLLLLPVFILIERSKKRDDAVKRRMKPLVDEIKRCYKGQERYYYIRTLHRQHGYSAFRSLVPVLTLLLQIPFFIAAYQFLEHFEPLSGQSFLFIQDLSEPDGLLGSINLLPIIMTLVNLVTAYFYTRNGDTGERKQMLVVAGLFLVLLYNFPSGLVLYWTMNNVFSFFRLFITNPEVFKKFRKPRSEYIFSITILKKQLTSLIPKLKNSFIVITVIAILFQLNWAFQHNFDGFFMRIVWAVGGSVLLTTFITLLNTIFIIPFPIRDKSIKEIFLELWPIFRATFFVITFLLILFQVNWALSHHFNDIGIRIVIAIAAGVVLTSVFAFATLAYQNRISIQISNFKLQISSLGKGYLVAFYTLSAILVFTQLNWAMQNTFNDIVIRISLVFSGSWFVILLLANLIEAIKRVPKSTIDAFRAQYNLTKPKFYTIFIVTTIITLATQLYWASQHTFDDIYIRIPLAFAASLIIAVFINSLIAISNIFQFNFTKLSIKPSLFFILLFLSAYFYFAAKYHFTGVDNVLAVTSIILLIPLQIIGMLFFIRLKKEVHQVLYHGVLFALIFIHIIQLLYVWSILNGNSIAFSVFSIVESSLLSLSSAGLLVVLIIFPFYWKHRVNDISPMVKNHWVLYILSIFYLCGFIFIWNPTVVYSTSPDSFSYTVFELLKNNLSLFVPVFFIGLFVYFIISKRYKGFMLSVMLTIGVIGFINSSIIPIDTGTLQMHRFSDTDSLTPPYVLYLLEALGMIAVYYLMLFFLKKGYVKQITVTLLILIAIPVFQSSIILNRTRKIQESGITSILDSRNLISFSKEKKNVVILMLDMFQGWYLSDILNETPELKSSFDGFVWYPNTVSVSNFTISSMPALLGGFDYTPEKLDADSVNNLYQKMSLVSEMLRDKVKSKGFLFSSNKIPWSSIDKNTFDTFIPSWHDDWNYLKDILNISSGIELGYDILWKNAAFFCSPLSIKPKIYDKGKWMNDEQTNEVDLALVSEYNFLRALPFISTTDAEDSNFILLCSKAPHFPWDIVDDEGNFIRDVGPFVNFKWTFSQVEKWMSWMKENGVYDNTKIIIVSDHGIRHTSKLTFDEIPFKSSDSSKISLDVQMAFTPLLMVKDHNSSGLLREDNRLMGNADVHSIAFDENDPTKVKRTESRTLDAFFMSWRIKTTNKQYPVDAWYKIKDNVYDLDNWRLVE
jgi:YidC/Oxa1 family membrane protein insertase